MATETLVFQNNDTPLDLLLFRRYGREVPGLAEQVLAANPGLSALGPRPPAGTRITVTIPAAPPTAAPTKLIRLYD